MPEERFNPEDDFGGMFDDEDFAVDQDEVETKELEDEEAFPGEDEEGAAESNRTFILAAAGLGLLVLLVLCLIGGWALFLRPRSAAERNAQATSIMLTNTALAATLTQTAQAAGGAAATPTEGAPQAEATATLQPTATPLPPTVTPTPAAPTATPVVFQPSPTPVVAAGGGATPTPLVNPTSIAATATAIAARAAATQQAATQQAAATALPETGLGDGLMGSPAGLLALAVLLVAIIVLARRARHA